MSARSEREVLVEYATRDEANLTLALGIAAAHQDICTRVIGDFVTAVASALVGKLGDGWAIITVDPNRVAERSMNFITLEYQLHPGRFTVIICSEEARYPKQAYFAVRAEGGNEHHKSVKQQLDQVAIGRVGTSSLWYRYFDPAYLNWGSEETTVLLYKKGEMVEYVLRYLEQFARAVERSLRTEMPPTTPIVSSNP